MNNFEWLHKVGATKEAIAVLNDQPHLFTDLLLVLLGLGLQCLLIWYIHHATKKPEQKKKKKKKKPVER
ncbi:Nck-associated protein 1 [Metarhizium album ARSEF 1941]|uniref:Nck-associated protein 1 n=1 Tax=Metarhizium album (strain ARSEF 1941) TaxID=1081103 RepID=A0A0B2WSD1_METAS|nr:Nck-associated protein 1 [Metarhizium album ARSEF 1941]KHN95860.1 Nck-associated protein 1 [Metarhizium album ARSEF 1941]